LDCGRQVGSYFKKTDRPDIVEPWDCTLEQQWDEKEQSEIAAIRMESDTIRRTKFEDGREKYREYLETQEWREKRALVLARDGHMCKGCGTERATDVHHQTYAHIYNEFLFELISLCRKCHDRVHSDSAEYADKHSDDTFESIGSVAARVLGRQWNGE
jgi:5-methylcytosine-specific restriction endonuclease McrA